MVNCIEDGEEAVRKVLDAEFPDEGFKNWNCFVDDAVANQIIRTVDRASSINVAKFIDDLRDG